MLKVISKPLPVTSASKLSLLFPKNTLLFDISIAFVSKGTESNNFALSTLSSASKDSPVKFIDVEHKERQTGEVSIKKWKLFVFCLKSFKEIIQFK